ncbi:MAG: hypothetical protein PHS41_06000 [Victivallaceae bacterium]|nr:hypothetical protein [Victivallaceae bacterium]
MPPPDGEGKMPCHHSNGWGIPFVAAVKYEGKWHYAGPSEQHNPAWEPTWRNEFPLTDLRVDGSRCCLIFRGELFQLELTVEADETLPVVKTWLSVSNCSERAVVVENLSFGAFYSVRTERNIEFYSDFRQDVAGMNRHFLGYCDFQFPDDVDMVVSSGESLDSFQLAMLMLPEEPNAKSEWRSRVFASLFQQCADSPTTFHCTGTPVTGKGIADFFPMIEACAHVGFEQIVFFMGELFTNTGDYRLRSDFFPNGETDLRRLLEKIASHGMTAGVYCSYSIAWRASRIRMEHPDWECIDESGRTFDPATFGNMCFLSPWGDWIRSRLLQLVDFGFAELEIDGPTSIPCFNPAHQHRSQGEYEYRNWLWERELFQELTRRGVRFTIPRGVSYLLMGACAIPGGYTEEDFCHTDGKLLLKNYRASMAAARAKLPAWCSWGFVLAQGRYHGAEASGRSATEFEESMFSLFGYGHARYLTGEMPYGSEKTAQILQRWLALFKHWKRFFLGSQRIVRAPGADSAECVQYIADDGDALCLMYNAHNEPVRTLFPLRIGKAHTVKLSFVTKQEEAYLQCDSAGWFALEETLTPGEVKICKIHRCE